MNEDIKRYLIARLKVLLIKQEMKERKENNVQYVKKTDAYKDLINFIEKYM